MVRNVLRLVLAVNSVSKALNCKTREIPIFGKRAKIIILVKNHEFILYISDDKTDFTVGIVSRNLASTSNFVEF